MPFPPLPILEPGIPSVNRCSDDYGTRLTLTACYAAGSQFPTGSEPKPYEVNGKDPPYVIPFAGQWGLSLRMIKVLEALMG